MRIWFDMETGDPDDFFTLAMLCGHPDVELVGVSLTPGTPHQVGVVRYCLGLFGLDVPVGVFDLDYKKAKGTPDERYVTCVSAWHYKAFGNIQPSEDADVAWKLLYQHLDKDTTLLTGGPLKNLGALLKRCSHRHNKEHPDAFIPDPDFQFPWVAQGGFAGQGVVPDDKQLDKFKGKVTCPTYNFNGDVPAALRAFDCQEFFTSIRLVSKNVCHGVYYDQNMHKQFETELRAVCKSHGVCDCSCHTSGGILHIMPCCYPCQWCGQMSSTPLEQSMDPRLRRLSLIYKGMDAYLQRKPAGKKFHDPLAAACAIDPEIGTWARVEMYRERGEWGCYLIPDSKVQIITDYDHERFVKVLLA